MFCDRPQKVLVIHFNHTKQRYKFREARIIKSDENMQIKKWVPKCAQFLIFGVYDGG